MYAIKTSCSLLVKILANKFILPSTPLHLSHKGQFLIPQHVGLSIFYLAFSTLAFIVRCMIFSPVFCSHLHLQRKLYLLVAGIIILSLL